MRCDVRCVVRPCAMPPHPWCKSPTWEREMDKYSAENGGSYAVVGNTTCTSSLSHTHTLSLPHTHTRTLSLTHTQTHVKLTSERKLSIAHQSKPSNRPAPFRAEVSWMDHCLFLMSGKPRESDTWQIRTRDWKGSGTCKGLIRVIRDKVRRSRTTDTTRNDC